VEHVYKLHGMQTFLISDRDCVFTSNLRKELFSLSSVQLRMSLAYHPQMDGQMERVNQCMETYFRCFIHDCPSKWSSWLSLAEFWYNMSTHSALGHSPFEVLYGHTPCNFGIDIASACFVSDLSLWLRERKVMQVCQHFLRAQDRLKRQANKGPSERTFQVGDQSLP
jgi:transposase InsO family protein